MPSQFDLVGGKNGRMIFPVHRLQVKLKISAEIQIPCLCIGIDMSIAFIEIIILSSVAMRIVVLALMGLWVQIVKGSGNGSSVTWGGAIFIWRLIIIIEGDAESLFCYERLVSSSP